MNIQDKLNKIRASTPKEVKLIIDHSFAIVDRMDEIMTKKKISQRQLAEMLGKKESEISKWMRGTHNFTIKTIAKLEAVLGESIFEVAAREPGIFVMNIQNGAKQQFMAVRGERMASSTETKYYDVLTSGSPFQVNELTEQYN